jgi:hypothetical protein
MNRSIKQHNYLFYRGLVAFMIAAPFFLVAAASTLPKAMARGELIVYGHGMVLAVAAAALVLRAMYVLGFRKASKMATAEGNYSLTA